MDDLRPDPGPADEPSNEALFCREALPAGTRFGEMEILRVVAVGGFGIVYRARDHLLDRDVAIKEFMPAQMARRGSGAEVVVRRHSYTGVYELGLRSFVNEAKLLAHFNHPAMVKVYRFWEANGTGYMVMPYLRGPTLHQLRRSMSMAPTEAWLRSIIDPLLDALEMLHAEGIYHRDIAPDNVLLPGTGTPVLLDFGAARRLIGDHTQSLTTVLKPGFAPIEQYAEATQLRQGPWTDVYALAAVVAYLLDAKSPPASTARAIHDEMPIFAQRRIPGVSAEFLEAVDWALAVRPQDRPSGVAQWRMALDRRIVAPPAIRLEAMPVLREALSPVAFTPTIALPRGETVSEPAAKQTAWTRAAAALRQPRRPVAWAGAALMLSLMVGMGLQTGLREPPPRQLVLADRVASLPAPRREPIEEFIVSDPRPVPIPIQAVAVLPPLQSSLQPATLSERVEPAPRRLIRAATGAATKPAAKRKSGTKAISQAARVAAMPGPRDACADRFFLTRPFCIQRLCDEPRYRRHPQCKAADENLDARRRTRS
jgi:hypothetical protein